MITFQENVSLKEHSNYKIGGPARYFFAAANENELQEAAREAKKRMLPIFALGGATNLLISDNGFNGLVVKLSPATPLEINGTRVAVGAGVLLSELLDETAKHNLSGLE